MMLGSQDSRVANDGSPRPAMLSAISSVLCHYDEARSVKQSDEDRQLETQRAIYRSGCLHLLEAFVDHQIALEMLSMLNHLM